MEIRDFKLWKCFAGRHVYTADERFQILRPVASSNGDAENEPMSSSSSTGVAALNNNLTEWILQIQFVQQRDAGPYICQVKKTTRRKELKPKVNGPWWQ